MKFLTNKLLILITLALGMASCGPGSDNPEDAKPAVNDENPEREPPQGDKPLRLPTRRPSPSNRPEQPTTPTMPVQPTTPTTPTTPVQPTRPEQPTDTNPTEPTTPTEPTAPENPVQPLSDNPGITKESNAGLPTEVYKAIVDNDVAVRLAEKNVKHVNDIFGKVKAVHAKELRNKTQRDKEVDDIIKGAAWQLRSGLGTLRGLTGIKLNAEEQEWANAINRALEEVQPISGTNAIPAKESFMPQSVYNVVLLADNKLNNAQTIRLLTYLKREWKNLVENTALTRLNEDTRKSYPVKAVAFAVGAQENNLNDIQKRLADRLIQAFSEEYVELRKRPADLGEPLFRAIAGKEMSTRIKNDMIAAFATASNRLLTPPKKLEAISDGLKDVIAAESDKDEILRSAVRLFQFTGPANTHWVPYSNLNNFSATVLRVLPDGAIVKDSNDKQVFLPLALHHGIPLKAEDQIILSPERSATADYTIPGSGILRNTKILSIPASGGGFVGFRI